MPINSEPADANANWAKGDAVEDSDERDVYRVDPLPPGLIPGYTTTEFDAASDQTTESPTMTTGSFQTFVKDEGGMWTEGPLLEGVQWNKESSVAEDTVAAVKAGVDGFWLTDTGAGTAEVIGTVMLTTSVVPAALPLTPTEFNTETGLTAPDGSTVYKMTAASAKPYVLIAFDSAPADGEIDLVYAIEIGGADPEKIINLANLPVDSNTPVATNKFTTTLGDVHLVIMEACD